jgi:hypothetical protein
MVKIKIVKRHINSTEFTFQKTRRDNKIEMHLFALAAGIKKLCQTLDETFYFCPLPVNTQTIGLNSNNEHIIYCHTGI